MIFHLQQGFYLIFFKCMTYTARLLWTRGHQCVCLTLTSQTSPIYTHTLAHVHTDTHTHTRMYKPVSFSSTFFGGTRQQVKDKQRNKQVEWCRSETWGDQRDTWTQSPQLGLWSVACLQCNDPHIIILNFTSHFFHLETSLHWSQYETPEKYFHFH